MIGKRIVWTAGVMCGAGLLVWLGVLLVPTDTAVDGAEGKRARPLIELVTPPNAFRPDALVVPHGLTGIGVRYGHALDPGQFRAWLNGEDLTRAFHPQPGKNEFVELDGVWLLGENVFRFEFTSLDGAAHSREYRVSVEQEAPVVYHHHGAPGEHDIMIMGIGGSRPPPGSDVR